MATDFTYSLSLVLIGIAAFAIVAIKARDRSGRGFLALGAKRIAAGYLGALVALLIYAILDALLSALDQMERGALAGEELLASIPTPSLELFVALAPVVVFAVTVGLLLLRLVMRARVVSMIGALALAVAYALARAYVAYTQPNDAWCAAHLMDCATRTFIEHLLIGVTVAIGFALAAGLPGARSPPQES